MQSVLDTSGSLEGFAAAVDEVADHRGVKSVLALSCADNGFSTTALNRYLEGCPLPLLGGLFPGILHQLDVYEKGTIAVGLPVMPTVQLIEGLSRKPSDMDAFIEAERFEKLSGGTMLVLVDGMSLKVNSFLQSVFNVIGLNMSYLGGGASSLDFEKRPSIFTNEGLKEDCAVLAHFALQSGIGVAHGMKPVSGPHKITGSTFDTITTIDWQPAASLYRKAISEHPDHSTELLSFLGTDAHFAIGLNRLDAERVVLEPIQETSDQSLVFMQEIREGEFIDIVRVDPHDVIESARSSRRSAIGFLAGNARPQTLITFDCVSRKLFLADDFYKELETLCPDGLVHVGALTCGGEIGTNGRDFLDYHNRTCVVGAFEV